MANEGASTLSNIQATTNLTIIAFCFSVASRRVHQAIGSATDANYPISP
jgi:hypothetical protein